MTEVSWKITCDNCGQELQETEEICPNCHSNKKQHFFKFVKDCILLLVNE